MACISPITIKLNTGHQQVPCSKCAFCLTSQRQAWQFRLHQELKYSESAKFITLTYDDDHIPLIETSHNHLQDTLSKPDIQKFLKRLRKHAIQDTKRIYGFKTLKQAARHTAQVRYYVIGEYGPETYRPHYHGIFFNLPEKTENQITEIWQKGNTTTDNVTDQRISYLTKYLITRHDENRMYIQKPFAAMSRKPAIGHQYLKTTQYHLENKILTVKNHNGTIQPLPRYYQTKMFTDPIELIGIKAHNEIARNKAEKTERKRNIKLGNIKEGDYLSTYAIQQQQVKIKKIERSAFKNQSI